jgi:hypothetical protein
MGVHGKSQVAIFEIFPCLQVIRSLVLCLKNLKRNPIKEFEIILHLGFNGIGNGIGLPPTTQPRVVLS